MAINWIKSDEQKPEPGKSVLGMYGKSFAHVAWVPAKWGTDDTMGTFDEEFSIYDEDDDCYYWPEGWYEFNHYDDTWSGIGPIPFWAYVFEQH